MTAACDPDYESQWDTPIWRIVYDWRLRCYRRQLESRLLFGRACACDPDAALAPDNTLFDPGTLRAVKRMAEELERNGPGTAEELRARLGTDGYYDAAAYAHRNGGDVIRVVGKAEVVNRAGVIRLVNVYGLAQHEGSIPAPMHPVLACLRDNGGWLSALEIAQATGANPSSVRKALDRYAAQLESYTQPVRKAGRDYRIAFFRYRGGR